MEAEKNTGIEYAKSLVDRLAAVHTLELEEYEQLISAQNSETAAYAAKKADFFRKQIYGTDVFIRGLIEVGSCCKMTVCIAEFENQTSMQNAMF